LILCCLPCRAAADDSLDEAETPVANRPPNFSGAIGSFDVAARAAPTTVQAEDPLIFTVRITGKGSLRHVRRPNLRQLPSFNKRFHIDNLDERDLPNERAREFDYRLRPRTAEVKQIPALPFVYFKPGFTPDYLGYQTKYAPAIPLRVKPRATVQASEVQGTVPLTGVPGSLYGYTEGPSVLRHTATFSLPGPFAVAVLVLGPPALCLAWHAAWRRRYPDAARVARQRRSRAARQALKALEGLGQLQVEQQAPRAEQVLVEYLRRRLDFGVEEPTPAEVAAYLQRAGSAPALVQEVTRFFDACAAARFGPEKQMSVNGWSAAAAQLVRSLEDQPWSAQDF
jgi:hypothetical protein